MQTDFTITYYSGKKTKVHQHQLAMTPAYAFTDYKAQGQTLPYMIVNIRRVPSGKLNQFSTYVLLSGGTRSVNLRVL
jgi:hypothetical protein